MGWKVIFFVPEPPTAEEKNHQEKMDARGERVSPLKGEVMAQVQRGFYMPVYEGFCSGCGNPLTYRIKDKYPVGVDRVSCSCGKELNVKFFPNDHGVMTMELREIKA